MRYSDYAITTPTTAGNEAVTVWVDSEMDKLMEEKPSARWAPDYWHPKYKQREKYFKGKNVVMLDSLKDHLTSGYRATLIFTRTGIPSLKVRNVLTTGVNMLDVDYLPIDSPANTENKKIKEGDIIINRSGTGSIGRMTVFIYKKTKAIITGDVYLLRTKGVNPYYLNVYLNSFFGKYQIHRFESGVSGQTKVDLDEILFIKVILLSDQIQRHVQDEYLKMSKFHNNAMAAKDAKDFNEYQINNSKAESMLHDLILRTEEVIRGERDDVV